MHARSWQRDSMNFRELSQPLKACPSPEHEKHKLVERESNVLGAAAVLATALFLDAANSLPQTGVQDAPASLRTSALVFSGLVAGKPFLPAQRAVLSAALLGVAVLGVHHQDHYARIADGVLCLVGVLCLLLLFSRKTSPSVSEEKKEELHRRENPVALVGALLLYLGARVARAGALHAYEVSSFSVTHNDFATRGFAASDDVVSGSLVFGGAIVGMTGVALLANEDSVLCHGSAAVASVVGMCAILAATAAFVCQLAFYARIDVLPAIFGDEACSGSRVYCAAAFRARRFFVANGSSSTLWVCAVGMLVLSFARSKRHHKRCDFHDWASEQNAHGTYVTWFAATFVGFAGVWFFSEPNLHYAAAELVLLWLSIPAAWYVGTFVGAVLHVSGQAIYMGTRFESQMGYSLNFYTHWCLAGTLVLVAVYGVCSLAARLLYGFGEQRPRSYCWWLDAVTGACVLAAISVQFVLTLATLGMTSGARSALRPSFRAPSNLPPSRSF